MRNEYNDDIRKAIEAMRKGGVILYPTDTVWGLGCDSGNQAAVEKIFSIKKRTDSKSLIVLVNSTDMLSRYVDNVPAVALQMAEISDTPMTIVYDRGRNLASGLTADDGSVGIRVTSDPFCNDLIVALRKPLVSTSANISGEATPAIFDEISEEIKSAVDYICEYRQEDRSRAKPSSVIKISENGVIKILRE